MRCLRRVWLTILMCLILVPAAQADWLTFNDPASGFAMNMPADWIVTMPDNGITEVYDLPVLRHYELNDPLATHAVYLYILDNAAEYPLDVFLYGDRDGAEVLIPRHLATDTDQDVVQVGYEYDPPLYLAIEVEVEHMVAQTADTFVYLQFYVSVGEEYQTLVDEIVTSFSVVPVQEQTSLGGLKALYRD